MFKAMTARQLGQITSKDIPPDLPADFQEVQIIFRQLHLSNNRPRFFDIDYPVNVLTDPKYKGIESFVRQVAAGNYVGSPGEKEEVRWLDTTVSRPTYIVLEILDGQGWYFSKSYKAVSLGEKSPSHPDPYRHYGRLLHVSDSGDITVDCPDMCRIAYFAALPAFPTTGPVYSQKLIYGIDVEGGTILWVDPDIRYPGVGSG